MNESEGWGANWNAERGKDEKEAGCRLQWRRKQEERDQRRR